MNHSHGYEMRLQEAARLRREDAAKKKAAREVREARMGKLDALARAIAAVEKLPELLAAYERTGDHDHGRGPIPTGGTCPGGDCLVAKARHIIQVACR